jgi:hypothetical protein
MIFVITLTKFKFRKIRHFITLIFFNYSIDVSKSNIYLNFTNRYNLSYVIVWIDNM